MRNTNITTADDNTCGRHSPVRPKTPPLSGDSAASPHPPAPLLHQEARRPNNSGDVITPCDVTPRADMPALRNARVSVRRRLFIEHQDDAADDPMWESDNRTNAFLESMRVDRERARQMWNFDFETETPLPGVWQWERVQQENLNNCSANSDNLSNNCSSNSNSLTNNCSLDPNSLINNYCSTTPNNFSSNHNNLINNNNCESDSVDNLSTNNSSHDSGDNNLNLNHNSQVGCGRRLSQDGLSQERRESTDNQQQESKQCGSLESSQDRCGDLSQNLNRSQNRESSHGETTELSQDLSQNLNRNQNRESKQGESTELSQNVKPDGIAVLSRGSCDESSQVVSIHDGITELSQNESHRVRNSKTDESIVDGIEVSSQGRCDKLNQAETDESIEILSQSKLNQPEADESNEGESQDKRFKMDESSQTGGTSVLKSGDKT